MRSRSQSMGLRTRLMATAIGATVMTLIVLTTAFNLILRGRLEADANDLLKARGSAALQSITVTNGQPQAPEAPDDAASVDRPVWVFAGRRVVEHPRATSALDAAARGMATSLSRRQDVAGTTTRLLALPVASDGKRVGTVVVAIDLSPYEKTERIALIASIALAGLLMLVVGFLSRWLLNAGLRPVRSMTARAAEWSEHDIDRRFELGPARDELTELAATLDSMLERLAASMRREQRFSAEISHELRTPLSRIRAQAQLAMNAAGSPHEREAWSSVMRAADEMSRTLEALLSAARAESADGARQSSDARAVAEAVVASCQPLALTRNLSLELEQGTGRPRAGIDSELLERLLHPIVDNACRYARQRVTVAVHRKGRQIEFEIRDDGPGVTEDEAATIFEPGRRGTAANAWTEETGAGLGLALAQRLAGAAGAQIRVSPGNSGKFLVKVPVT